MRRVMAVLVALVSLTGCVGGVGGPSPTGPAVMRAASTTASPSPVDLVALRRSEGIPDCPASTTAAPVTGGLPDVELACLGGGSTMRLAGLRGPLVVNFWAQWCGPCRTESGHLREFSTLAAGKVTMLGIDGNDPREDYAVEFAGVVSWKYVQLYDPDKVSMSALGFSTLPHTLFVDAKGVIVYHKVGAFTSTDEIRQAAQQYLGVAV